MKPLWTFLTTSLVPLTGALLVLGCEAESLVEPEQPDVALGVTAEPGIAMPTPGDLPEYPDESRVPSQWQEPNGAWVSENYTKLDITGGTLFKSSGSYDFFGNRMNMELSLNINSTEGSVTQPDDVEFPIFHLYWPRQGYEAHSSSWRAPGSCGHTGNLTAVYTARIDVLIEVKGLTTLSSDRSTGNADASQPDCPEEEEEPPPVDCDSEPADYNDGTARCEGEVDSDEVGGNNPECLTYMVEWWYWTDTGEIVDFEILYCSEYSS